MFLIWIVRTPLGELVSLSTPSRQFVHQGSYWDLKAEDTWKILADIQMSDLLIVLACLFFSSSMVRFLLQKSYELPLSQAISSTAELFTQF